MQSDLTVLQSNIIKTFQKVNILYYLDIAMLSTNKEQFKNFLA